MFDGVLVTLKMMSTPSLSLYFRTCVNTYNACGYHETFTKK